MLLLLITATTWSRFLLKSQNLRTRRRRRTDWTKKNCLSSSSVSLSLSHTHTHLLSLFYTHAHAHKHRHVRGCGCTHAHTHALSLSHEHLGALKQRTLFSPLYQRERKRWNWSKKLTHESQFFGKKRVLKVKKAEKIHVYFPPWAAAAAQW